MSRYQSGVVEIESRFLGLISYDTGLLKQEAALLRLDHVAASILGLEHAPVVTLGVRGHEKNDLMIGEEDLARKGFILRKSPRGGQATLHAPGQLVIYPCCDLKKLGMGPKEFVAFTQDVTAAWLTSLGVSSERHGCEPGLFVRNSKLAAFGFRISSGKTSHGIAVNVSNQLDDFGLIRTCGVMSQRVTRLADLGVSKSLPSLFSQWVETFETRLGERRKV